MRCSHFLSVCHYAQVVRGAAVGGWQGWQPPGWAYAAPCDNACNRVLGQTPFAMKLSEANMDRSAHSLHIAATEAARLHRASPNGL